MTVPLSSTPSEPLEVLSKHGKSFRFAGALLSKERLDDAARLYRFCRWVDDLADQCADHPLALEQLDSIERALTDQRSDKPIVSDFIALQKQVGIHNAAPFALLDGMRSDLGKVAVQSEEDLVRYAYRAAGTVGLMMCPVLGAAEAGWPHGVDLGIAMQLTNIARDVAEDAAMGRRYLPEIWCPFPAQRLIRFDDDDRSTVQQAIQNVLQMAERYYASAVVGLAYLPFRSRLAIAAALAIYREIGLRLEHHNYAYWQGRVVVPVRRKVMLTLSRLPLQCISVGQPAEHDPELHKPLTGLYPV
ncbi:phytoene/squalene synthase family protein [Endozoicomonas lisbonensis]|uniref:Phytoene synthase n=1 Tax=Endozoicomonas lisbonensis TaxID=3120522 RepID=A0ABV2SBV8_9GAMM